MQKEALDILVCMLSPFVPHLCEELWKRLGHTERLSETSWPVYDPQAVIDDELLIVVQVNGKLRSKLQVSATASEDEVTSMALADPEVAVFTEGKQLRKVIYVPGKLVNIVAA